MGLGLGLGLGGWGLDDGAWTRVWEDVWCYVCVCVVSLIYLYRWPVLVSVYCARRIPEHL